ARKAATQKLSDEAGAAKATIGTLYRLAPEPRTFGELTFESPSECAIAAARGYLVKGLLAGGDVACIFGAPGAGKSLIAPHIGYMVARGEQAFGMRTKPGRVFYVAAEDLSGLRRRVAALRLRHGDATEFRVVGGVSDLLDDDSPHLQALREAISDQMPVLIFVDTLAMAFPGLEENDARSMGRVVAVARQLAEYGAAVVLIHHDTKDEGSTPRGHSILNGALDAAMHVKRDDEGIVRGRLTKNRNGACDRDIAFRIGVETLGHDEDGDPETAALVDELPASTLSMAPRLSPGQREALAILRDLEAAGDVFEEAWRDACIDGRRVSQSEEREGRKRAFNRARRDLAERRLPARLQQHLAHLSPHDLSVIDREVRDGLTELANDDL
ncbi:MAG: AAA family ATPase, partial [Acidobacteriota bacterium]